MFRLVSHMIYNDVMHCSVVHDVMSLHYHYNALRYVHRETEAMPCCKVTTRGGQHIVAGGSTEGQVDRGAGRR